MITQHYPSTYLHTPFDPFAKRLTNNDSEQLSNLDQKTPYLSHIRARKKKKPTEETKMSGGGGDG